MRPSPGESGVSPMIGTILVLGISVAGTAFALLMGAPVLQRLQEQAALDAMTGQFASVREAGNAMSIPGDGRSIGLSMPSGKLVLEPGTRWMVTIGQDTFNRQCDFQVVDWSDGDSVVHIVRNTGCRDLVGNPQVDCALASLGVPLVATACVEVALLQDDGTEVPIDLASGPSSGTELRLQANIEETSDYVFRLTDRDNQVFAESWLLHTDRLHWAGGRVSADFEAGAVIAHARAGDRVVAQLRVDEGSATTGPALLVLPVHRIATGGEVSGTGVHTLGVELNRSLVRHQDVSYLVRIDFLGDNDLLLCESLLARNEQATVDWQADGAAAACGTSSTLDTQPPLEDDAVTVRFDQSNNAPTFIFTQMIFTVTLHP